MSQLLQSTSKENKEFLILIWDLHPDASVTISEMVKSCGYQTATVKDVKNNIWRQINFDVVLLDIGHARPIDLDTGRMIKSLQPQIKLIATSAYLGESTPLHAEFIDRFLAKPFTLNALRAALEKVTGLS
ncbi:response regulator [Herbaspirillum sp. GCM10030257]|uniref:response regulator n=1 Tax=Herbaspirillum sp. GCM10030257 TaxID=3273393 RepID=UPI00362196DB